MLGDDDAPLQAKALAELLLPELNGGRIFQRGESVIEDYLWDRWRMLVHESILNPHGDGINPLISEL